MMMFLRRAYELGEKIDNDELALVWTQVVIPSSLPAAIGCLHRNPICGRFYKHVCISIFFDRMKTKGRTSPIQLIVDAYKTEELWWDRTATRPGGLTSRHWVRGQAGGLAADGATLATNEKSRQKRQKGQYITFRNLHETFSTLLRFCMPMYSSHLRSLPWMKLRGH